MNARRDQPGDMRHIDHHQTTRFVADLPKPGEIECARVGARAGNDEFGFLLEGLTFESIVIERPGVRIHFVVEYVEILPGKVHGMAM